mgnify:CR=1 FL=1|tara:strand:- start:41 stop:232 length:192 start_codon:yes stop_codon:yes gene_type:complete
MGALTYNTGFVKKLTGRDANMPAEVEPDEDEIEPITTVSDDKKKKKKAFVPQLFIPDSALKED